MSTGLGLDLNSRVHSRVHNKVHSRVHSRVHNRVHSRVHSRVHNTASTGGNRLMNAISDGNAFNAMCCVCGGGSLSRDMLGGARLTNMLAF